MIISAHSPSWPWKYKLKICAKYPLCPFFGLSSAFHEAKVRMASRLNITVSLINQDEQHNKDFQQKKPSFLFCIVVCLLVWSLRFESSTLIFYKELSSFIFQSLSVRHAWHLYRSPPCAIYKGMRALYWPSIINYQLLRPHSVLNWPSTQLHHLVTHSWANWI